MRAGRSIAVACLLLAGTLATAIAQVATPPPTEAEVAAFLARMEELASAPLDAGGELDAAAAATRERDDIVDKGRRLVEKLRATQLQLAELRELLTKARENLEVEGSQAAAEPARTTVDEVTTLEQAVELARYSVANRQRRLVTLRADLLSVRDRIEESQMNQAQARARPAGDVASSPEAILAAGQLEMELFRERYLALLYETRQTRYETAEIELRAEERDLDRKRAAMKMLRGRLGVTKEEAARHVERIEARERELGVRREALDAERQGAAALEREADLGLHRIQEGRPSEAELTFQRTRLDTALELTKAVVEETGRVDLEGDLLGFQKRSWVALSQIDPRAREAPARDRAARRQITDVETAQARTREHAASVARLIQIAKDDVSQIEEGISYSRSRVEAADEMSAGAARQGMKGLDAKRALLEATVESLMLALVHARRRLSALEEEERLLGDHLEHLAETRERLEPLLVAGGERVTLDSFRDLGTTVMAAARRLTELVRAPGEAWRAVTDQLRSEERTSRLSASVVRVALIGLLGGLLVVALGRGIAPLREGAAGSRRAAATFAADALVPALLVAVVFLGLVPSRPELPAAADVEASATVTRAGATILDTAILLALVSAVVLTARGVERAAQAGGVDADALLRWRFVLGWTDIAFLSWLTLRHLASLARIWGAPRSVPFLVDAAALLAALFAAAVTLLRLRPQVERALRARRSEGAAAAGMLAGAWNVVAHWFTHLLVVGLLALLGLHSAGYGDLARYLFLRSLQTALVALAAVSVVRLSQRRVDWRLAALDRLQSATGQPHTVAREVARLSHVALLLAVVVAALLLVLGAWGVETREAAASGRELLAVPLFTVNQTTITPMSVAAFLAIIAGAIVVSRGANRLLLTKVFPRSSVDKGVQNALATIANYVILLVAFFAGFQTLGFDLTTLKVVAGAVGLGIGFGLQSIAANFISGLVILLERPFKPDDVVEVHGILGRVEAVSARATHLRTRDNVSVIVPNTDLVSGVVVNWTGRDSRVRIHVSVGVAYATDPALLQRVLMGVALANPKVLRVPEPEVRLLKFGESAIEFELLAWLEEPWPSERIKSDLYYAVEEALRTAGIEIPIPQRRVHIATDGARLLEPPPGRG